MKETFDRIDADKDGMLSSVEVQQALTDHFEPTGPPPAIVQALVGMQQISFPDVCQIICHPPKSSKFISTSTPTSTGFLDLNVQALRKAFDAFDENENGTLDVSELISGLQTLGVDDSTSAALEWMKTRYE